MSGVLCFGASGHDLSGRRRMIRSISTGSFLSLSLDSTLWQGKLNVIVYRAKTVVGLRSIQYLATTPSLVCPWLEI